MNLENFALKLKAARKERNLTQDQLGQMCGLSGQTIWSYETGYVKKPKKKNVRAILRVLPISGVLEA